MTKIPQTLFAIIFVFVFTSSCSAGKNKTSFTTPTISLTTTFTATKLPTVSPIAIQTTFPAEMPPDIQIPTSVPIYENGLSEEGPWFVYRNGRDDIMAVNQDGTGKTMIKEVNKGRADVIGSSNSNFLVIFEGSICTILTFPDLTIQAQIDNYAYEHNHPEATINENSIIAIAPVWSPDGRYLAFSAVIDGSSSDLYTYDTVTKQITQVSDGPNQIGNFEWSPDSKWIIYEEIGQFFGYEVEGIWLTAPFGKMNTLLYKPEDKREQNIFYWIDDQSYIAYSDSISQGNVQLIDLQSGLTHMLIRGAISFDPAHDPITRISAFGTDLDFTEIKEAGKPVIFDPTDRSLKSVNIYSGMIYWDKYINMFVTHTECQNDAGNLSQYAFSTEGNVICLDDSYETPFRHFQSPDEVWYLDSELIDDDKVKLSLFKNEKSEFYHLSIYYNYLINWRPDSKGFFIIEPDTMTMLTVDGLNPIIIDDDIGFQNDSFDIHYYDIAWIGEFSN